MKKDDCRIKEIVDNMVLDICDAPYSRQFLEYKSKECLFKLFDVIDSLKICSVRSMEALQGEFVSCGYECVFSPVDEGYILFKHQNCLFSIYWGEKSAEYLQKLYNPISINGEKIVSILIDIIMKGLCSAVDTLCYDYVEYSHLEHYLKQIRR